MISRIKYSKPNEKGVCKSVTGLRSDKNGATYIVYMNIVDKTYYIMNPRTYRKYYGGEGINNLHVLKRNIRQHLQNLGVVFKVEVRDRDYGRCKKGEHSEKKDAV